jgi:hypothetical protein
MQEMNFIVARDICELPSLAEYWQRLRGTETRYVPDFDDVLNAVARAPNFFVFLEMNNEEPVCMACFVEERDRISFTVGEKLLGSVAVQQLSLIGSVVLGHLSPTTWLRFLTQIDLRQAYDFINLGEVPLQSDLCRVVAALPIQYRVSKPARKEQVRWLINLPNKFDDYIGSLRSKSRQIIRQSLRKFEAGKDCSLSIISEEHQIGEFLMIGEAISRATYQWSVGQRLNNDASTRNEYVRLAQSGKLRCYLLQIEGVPCAFARGTLVDGVYHYETPGYLPEYAKWSPGTVLLMLVIKDLIESASCKIFDFGAGGDNIGYKAKFGNVSIPSQTLLISSRAAFRPALISIAQEALLATKSIAARLLGTGALRRSIRRAMRG